MNNYQTIKKQIDISHSTKLFKIRISELLKSFYPVGTIREWKDGKYKKVADDKWVKVKEENTFQNNKYSKEYALKIITEWATQDNFEKAKGKTRDEIFKMFGNVKIECIGKISDKYLKYFSAYNVKSSNIYCGKGYFIDHIVNHHPNVPLNDYKLIPDILENPDKVQLDNKKDNVTLIFKKKFEKWGTVVIACTAIDDKLIFYKTGFTDKKESYKNKPELSEDATPQSVLQYTAAGTRNISTRGNSDVSTIPHSIEKSTNELLKSFYPIGTIREWKDGKYKKVADDKWIKITIGKEKNIKTIKIRKISEITNDNFFNLKNNYILPPLCDKFFELTKTKKKSLLLKNNISIKNSTNHKELNTPLKSKYVLKNAIENFDIVECFKSKTKPNYYSIVKTGEAYFIANIDTDPNKEFNELIGWWKVDKKRFEKMKENAEKEDGESLITIPKKASADVTENSNESYLSALQFGNSTIPHSIEKSTNELLKSFYPVGTIRDWKDGKYKKVADDKWVKVKETGHAANLRKILLKKLTPYLNKLIINDETNIAAYISKKSINKMGSEKAIEKSKNNGFTIEEHFKVANNIIKLYKKAKLKSNSSPKEKNQNLISIKRFVAKCKLNKIYVNAYITVKESNIYGHKIYSVEVMELKKNAVNDMTAKIDKVNKGTLSMCDEVSTNGATSISKNCRCINNSEDGQNRKSPLSSNSTIPHSIEKSTNELLKTNKKIILIFTKSYLNKLKESNNDN